MKAVLQVYQLVFWKAYWITLRPYLTFISGTAGLVGLAFVPETTTVATLVTFFILFFSYGFGQALTDCFQTDTDSLSSPYRPLVRGLISKQQVVIISLSGLLIGTLLLTSFNLFILFPALLSVFGLISYTFFKRTWWGGPPWNSWIVALLPVIARMTDKNFQFSLFVQLNNETLSFWLAVGAIFFGYLNFVVMGYFKDISADRSTDYFTFPVVFGWKAAAIYSDIAAFVATSCVVVVFLLLPQISPLSCLFFFAGIIINSSAQIDIHKIRDEAKTFKPIANVVRAFILYGLAIVVVLKPSWVIWLLIYYALFEVNLKYRPEKSQI